MYCTTIYGGYHTSHTTATQRMNHPINNKCACVLQTYPSSRYNVRVLGHHVNYTYTESTQSSSSKQQCNRYIYACVVNTRYHVSMTYPLGTTLDLRGFWLAVWLLLSPPGAKARNFRAGALLAYLYIYIYIYILYIYIYIHSWMLLLLFSH